MRFLVRLLLSVTFLTPSSLWAQPYAGEDSDAGVAPVSRLRLDSHSAPTPLEIPGGKRLLTEDLRALLWQAEPPVLFDVLGGDGHESLPDAIWLPGAGRGRSFEDELQRQLARVLETTTKGNKQRAVVFFCASKNCWLSYNAALRAALLGYTQVYWYRGGIEAWLEAGQPLAPMKVSWRRPQEGG